MGTVVPMKESSGRFVVDKVMEFLEQCGGSLGNIRNQIRTKAGDQDPFPGCRAGQAKWPNSGRASSSSKIIGSNGLVRKGSPVRGG